MTAEEMRAEKARGMRYKKPIVCGLTIEAIEDDLYAISGECDEVRYAIDGDDGDEILSSMLGDEEDAWQFKMEFSDLAAECEQFRDDLSDWEWRDYLGNYYDLFMVNGNVASEFGGLAGWDIVERDYLGLQNHYEEEGAVEAAHDKLKKELTKDKLLDMFRLCMKVFTNYVGICYRYDCLKASMDILRQKNSEHLKAVTEINKLYIQADEETGGFQFTLRSEAFRKLEEIIDAMPQEAFL